MKTCIQARLFTGPSANGESGSGHPTRAGSAWAQSVCVGDFLGAGGVEELCVHINETETGATFVDRGSSPFVILETVGDYLVDLEVTFASDGGGTPELQPQRRRGPAGRATIMEVFWIA